MVFASFSPLFFRAVRNSVKPEELPVVSFEEVNALLIYSSRNKINKEKIVALSDAIRQEAPRPSDVASAYVELVSETYPVTGRTVLDSQNTIKRFGGIGILTVLLFLLAAGNHIADSWQVDTIKQGSGGWFVHIKCYIWDYFTPFFWGCLGTCVFYLKQIKDLSNSFKYEHKRFQGWLPGVLLGGILGAILVAIVDKNAFGSEVKFSTDTCAFIAGMGVEVVYSTFERFLSFVLSIRTK